MEAEPPGQPPNCSHPAAARSCLRPGSGPGGFGRSRCSAPSPTRTLHCRREFRRTCSDAIPAPGRDQPPPAAPANRLRVRCLSRSSLCPNLLRCLSRICSCPGSARSARAGRSPAPLSSGAATKLEKPQVWKSASPALRGSHHQKSRRSGKSTQPCATGPADG
jgi:hypothetical protein